MFRERRPTKNLGCEKGKFFMPFSFIPGGIRNSATKPEIQPEKNEVGKKKMQALGKWEQGAYSNKTPDQGGGGNGSRGNSFTD